MWLAAVTMTTGKTFCVCIPESVVGFGDYSAKSHFGRLITVLVIFWGIFLVSLMVVTLTNSMTLDPKETRAFNILYRLKSRKELQMKASSIITTCVRIRGLDKDFNNRLGNAKSLEESNLITKEYEAFRAEFMSKLDIQKQQFILEKRNLRSADTDPVEEIRKISQSIDHDFDELRKFLITIDEIESNLDAISASHDTILKVLKECKDFQQLFSQELLRFKGGIFNVKK